MNTRIGGGIIAVSTTLLLTITPLVSAETPARSIRDSQILPYLLENPRDRSLVRVRCVSKFRQEQDRKRSIIRDSLLRPNGQGNDTVTIEIEGSCRHVRIRSQDYLDYSHYPANPDFEDDWLTRQGSGWDWLLRHQR
ncbi:hypothetical protein [Anabaena sp. CA = ATCC 33047]|uniref:hypothetical protein n=1 Tax=Anabaena sp. (strain CA / ATCC 33047) TaxID=52271 RepID=UPI0008338026|nr:hypothetical protein [Anabaena sp. CA = ATCC 33047]